MKSGKPQKNPEKIGRRDKRNLYDYKNVEEHF